jgi:hypothetical protein
MNPEKRSSAPSLSITQVDKMLEIQEQNLAIKAQELELKKSQDLNAFEFGKRSLELQASDMKDQRVCAGKESTKSYIFSGVVIFLIVALLATAILCNKEDVAKELIKIIGYMGAGALGGYGFAVKQAKKNEEEED